MLVAAEVAGVVVADLRPVRDRGRRDGGTDADAAAEETARGTGVRHCEVVMWWGLSRVTAVLSQ